MTRAADDMEFRAWIDRARAVTTIAVAERLGFRARASKSTTERVGPCPSCGTAGSKDPKNSDRFAIGLSGKTRGVFNCRQCKIAGNDGVGLVMQVNRVGFLEACEWLVGSRPGATATAAAEPAKPTAGLAETQGREAWAAGVKDCPYGPEDGQLLAAWTRGHLAARDEERHDAEKRAGERGRAHMIWREGGPIGHRPDASPAACYLASRGLSEALLWNLRLRCHSDLPYWHEGRQLGSFPAMLAAMVRNDGVFGGVHITWLAPDGSGKAEIVDPDSGEILPSKIAARKKMRGEKRGCHIELLRPDVGDADRLVIGEGIENVLSAALMMRGGALWPATTWWTACDLGNLGGPSLGSVPHPWERVERNGRDGTASWAPRMVTGPEPAWRPDWPAIAPPKSAREIVVLGDGDSDPFATRNVVERARRRWTAGGFSVRPVFADDGIDFNDMWRARLAEGAAA